MGARGNGKGRVARIWARAFHSVRGRVTVLAVAISGVLLLLCMLLALALDRQRYVMDAAGTASHTARTLAVKAAIERQPETLVWQGKSRHSDRAQIVADDGTVLAATAELRGRAPISRALPDDPDDFRVDETDCENRLGRCTYTVGFRVPESAYGVPVTVYSEVTLPGIFSGDAAGVVLRGALLLITVMALIGLGTWVAIGAALRPVREITEELADITVSDLSRRVPVHYSGGGEVQELGETVNRTLEHLQGATERQRRFVAEASHDLRNPIAGLLARLEVLDGEDEDYPWKEVVHEAVHDVERLSAIVEDLLELARLESGSAPPVRLLDLGGLIGGEISQRMSDRLPITTDLAPGVWVRGSALRLGRVLENLLANAERHGRTEVRVEVAADGDQAVLRVIDDGDGVPEESRERIFERFARLKESKERDLGGTGLGLPIAREIAHTHGGTLAVADGPGGRFELRLPLAEPP